MPKIFEGRTEDAEAPFLSGGWWKEGVEVRGLIEHQYPTEFGLCHVLELEAPVDIPELELETVSKVSMGNLAGFTMALQAAGARPRIGDSMEIECTGFKPAKGDGYSPRPNFRIKIARP